MKHLIHLLLCLPLFASAQVGTGELITVPNKGARGSAAKEYGVVHVTDTAGRMRALMFTKAALEAAATLADKNPEDVPEFVERLPVVGRPGHAIDGRDLGMKADWNPATAEHLLTDNAYIIQRYLDSIPEFTGLNLLPPPGFLFAGKEIRVPKNKWLKIEGIGTMPYIAGPSVTTFRFRRLSGGFQFPAGSLSSELKNIRIVSNGTLEGQSVSGIYHETVCRFDNVWVDGFSYGAYVQATVANGGNASLSFYANCRFSNNTVDGIYLSGEDANIVMFLNCATVQNFRNGFTDNSLLGNIVVNLHTATNGRRGSEALPPIYGRPVSIVSATAATSITGLYIEDDQAASYINPSNRSANVRDGMLKPENFTGSAFGQPYTPAGGSIQGADWFNSIRAPHIETQRISFGEMSFRQRQDYGKPGSMGIYSWDLPIFQAVSANSSVAGQQLPTPSIAISGPVIQNGRLEIEGMPGMQGIPFQVGAKIIASPYDPNKPEYYRIVTAGRWNTLKPFTVDQRWGTGDNEWYLSLKGRESDLLIGDAIRFDNGETGTVIRKIDRYTVTVDKPQQSEVREGNQINYFNGLLDKLNPIGYEQYTLSLTYAPFTKVYKLGEPVTINGGTARVKSVSIERGVQTIEVPRPENGDPKHYADPILSPYKAGNNVGWGPNNLTVTPVAYGGAADQPTVFISFPMSELQSDARVPVNLEMVRVARVEHPGIIVKVSGNIHAAKGFVIPEPTVKAYN